jgi:hypothetical protein
MEMFYKIVIIVAVILLILILTYIGILLAEKKLTGENLVGFPPVKSSCPDNWEAKVDANNKVFCVVPSSQKKNVGTILDESIVDNTKMNYEMTSGYDSTTFSGSNVINFDDSLWAGSGKSADCAKKDWANTYDILWDGISNYTNCN